MSITNTFSPPSSYSIIVHCHLRWDFVWQRPQQFHSRLAKRHRILFVEGPRVLSDDDLPTYFDYEVAEGHPNVTILRTYFSASDWAKGGEFVDAKRRELLNDALCGPLRGRYEGAVQWFYDPMAVESHLGHHKSIATVYDCMDELSQFKFAPTELITRERRLLLNSDVVFTGGRKMCESKSRYNTNCHFYGCGVDIAHFGKARLSSTEVPTDIAHLTGPILGYFGVVDERLDYDLISRLASTHPEWHIVIVGPTAKVDPAALPQHQNLHWMGGRDYSELPAYTKAFDVCLMPFALNEATEYINPTKALEYMATATPIVSTPVSDVVANFSKVVKISANSDEFIQLCEAEVNRPDHGAMERGLKMAAENTWDAIVAKLEKHIEDALTQRSEVAARLHIPIAVPRATSPLPASSVASAA